MTDKLMYIVVEFWKITALMAPALLFGLFIAGIVSAYITPDFIKKHMGKSNFWQICKASFFGVPLPICSCGVVPVAASLRQNGAGRGSTISFLTSTPQTGIDSIFITYSLLGPLFAVVRVAAAFVSGILTGSVVRIFAEDRTSEKKDNSEDCCCDSCNGEKDVVKKGRFAHMMWYGFVKLPDSIGRAMLVGLILSAVISVFVPENFFADRFVGNEWASMFVMLLVGTVVYVCSSSSVPIVLSLIVGGISPGAGLVFLITGPATNIASITTLIKILGFKTMAIYLVTLAVSALAFGYILNMYITPKYVADIMHAGHESLSVLQHVSAGVLILLLMQPFFTSKHSVPCG